MRRGIVTLLAMALSAVLVTAGDTETFGKGVTLDEAVAIETLLEDAEQYVGKTVRVDGVVTAVCKKRGCWMEMTNPDTGVGVRIKVEDGVIVFPYTSMGHKASAEGVFEAIKLTPEQVEAMKAHHAREHGDEHGDDDHAGCIPQMKGDSVYQIRGTGAVIHS
jgi:hypothetical protein